MSAAISHARRHNQPDNSMKTVDQLLDEARSMLPDRPTPQQTLREFSLGAFVVDIRGDEQQRRDGLIPGAAIIRRNVLEWRCDPKSEWRDSRVKSHEQRVILVCDEGYQSSLAAANLQLLGMINATDMAGGFQQWRKEGLPVTPYGAGLRLRGFTTGLWHAAIPSGLRNWLRMMWQRGGAHSG
jgi:rhodanese-related sulfurtransferase